MGILIIDSTLCDPPSEVSCFRDVTLYGKVFIFDDILLECALGTRSFYWKWLKRYGAHDYISQLIKPTEKESGFKIGRKSSNLNIDKITSFNLSFIISALNNCKN